MDITKIEMLLRALELGSMSKAAQEYSYTPSAFTHIINGIESELGTTLVARTNTGISLAEGKEEMLSKLKELVDIKNQLHSLALRDKQITVVAYPSLTKSLLPHLTRAVSQAHPEARINIIVADRLRPYLGVADLFIGEHVTSKDYVWKEILKDTYTAVVYDGYECGEIFEREKKHNEKFILVNDKTISAYVANDNFESIIHLESADDSSVIEMVKQKMGITILPRLSVNSGEKGIRQVPLDPPIERRLGIMYSKKQQHNPIIKTAVKCLSDISKLLNK